MTGTMTWAAMDVHARSTTAAALDVQTGELARRRFDTGGVDLEDVRIVVELR